MSIFMTLMIMCLTVTEQRRWSGCWHKEEQHDMDYGDELPSVCYTVDCAGIISFNSQISLLVLSLFYR